MRWTYFIFLSMILAGCPSKRYGAKTVTHTVSHSVVVRCSCKHKRARLEPCSFVVSRLERLDIRK